MKEGQILPVGWQKNMVMRKTGASAGKYDVYIITDDGKRFRSRNELMRYCEEYVIDNIDINAIFSKTK